MLRGMGKNHSKKYFMNSLCSFVMMKWFEKMLLLVRKLNSVIMQNNH